MMNTRTLPGAWLALLAAGFVLSALPACSESSRATVSGTIPSSGKVTAPIALSYTVPAKGDIGQPAEVTVTVEPLADVDDLRLSVSEREHLELIAQNREFHYGRQTAGAKFSERLVVVPRSNGTLYLNVFASAILDGNRMLRSGVVPIRVGEGDGREALERPGRLDTDVDGRKIVVMPEPDKQRK